MVLGGQREGRVREALRLGYEFPSVKIVVGGDGRAIVEGLVDRGLEQDRIEHEIEAKSTYENAKNTAVFLDALQAEKIALVTSWSHVARAQGTFKKVQPARVFHTFFEARPTSPDKRDRECCRRERFAATYYLLRYGIWAF